MEPGLPAAGTGRDDHHIDPVKDSWYTKIGTSADLFRTRDYPIEAVCGTCNRPIIAQHFLGDWAHFDRPAAGRPQGAGEPGPGPGRAVGMP